MQNYRNLLVWQKAHALALEVQLMTESWNGRGNPGLIGQIRRASLSIPSSIVEGASRGADRDFAKFIQIAIGSATEVEYQLHFAIESGTAAEESTLAAIEKAREVRRMLIGLLKKLR